MVNMAAAPVAMMAGCLSGASRTDMHTGRVQHKQICLLIPCNSTQHSCKLGAIEKYIIAGAIKLTHMAADAGSR